MWSLDCDFIGAEEDLQRHIRRFRPAAQDRVPDKAREDSINRLYVVESLMTLTGVNADHRLRVPPSAVLPVAAALAAEILPQRGGELAGTGRRWASPPRATLKWISECAKDLPAQHGATASWSRVIGNRWRCICWPTP